MPKYLSFPLERAKEILGVLLKTSEGAEADYIRSVMSRARENTTKGLASEGRMLLNEQDGTWLRSRASSLSGKWVDRTLPKGDKLVKTTRIDDGAPTTMRAMGTRAFDDISRDSALRQERNAAKSGRKLNRTRFTTTRNLEEDTF